MTDEHRPECNTLPYPEVDRRIFGGAVRRSKFALEYCTRCNFTAECKAMTPRPPAWGVWGGKVIQHPGSDAFQ